VYHAQIIGEVIGIIGQRAPATAAGKVRANACFLASAFQIY